MQTDLSPELANHPEGLEAQRLLSNCVHCGFCTATCPTYQLLGDELDGPRGRIYLIKQMAEGKKATEKTREHLDRCLTCRNCESTCPSGVQYGHLVDIGRKWAEEQTSPRPTKERLIRFLLKETLTRPSIFNPAMKMGRTVKMFLPTALQKKIPDLRLHSSREHAPYLQSMILLEGCVQPGMMPSINVSTRNVLGQLGVKLISPSSAGCCGALKFHLNDHEGGKDNMRNNIDAWWPLIQSENITAILMNASGCGVTVKDYAYLLKDDPQYAVKAKKISDLTKDISEILPAFASQLLEKIGSTPKTGVVYHPPCTLQHGQQIRGKVESLLEQLGVKVAMCEDSHLCCGSAGTYSILQEKLSNQLRNQKLEHLTKACETSSSSCVVSGNIGCITQLQNNDFPVKHWIELIDELLPTS